MKASEAIKAIMVDEGLRQADLAHRLDVTRATLWARLNQQDRMTIALFESMVKALGYKLTIEPMTKTVTDVEGNIVRTRKKYEVTE